MSVTIQWSADTISGTRKVVNDDSWVVFSAGASTSASLSAENAFTLDESDLVLAVSDGMGGGNAGDLASQLILEQFTKIIPKTLQAAASGFEPDYIERLNAAIFETHESINLQGSQNIDHQGMGATITLTWFTPTRVYIAHVGDSRLYRHREGETEQLTEDHTYIWKKFNTGEISEMQFRRHPRRSVLYEVLGGGHQSLRPQILSFPYALGDRYMLCSDGIIDGLNQSKVHKKLSQKECSTKEVLDSLISSAIEISGDDDTTCIVFDVG